ncbi:MAG: S8 family serine peptidase [Chitinophagales bacterium]
MKKLAMLFAVLLVSLSFSNVYAQFTRTKTPVFNQKTNPKLEQPVFTNPNLKTEGEEIVNKQEPEELVPNSYIIFFNPKAVPAFTDVYSDEKFENREQLLEAFAGFEKQSTAKIMDIIQGKMGIDAKQVQQVYTGAISGFAAKMSDSQAKELAERAKGSELVQSIGQDIYVNFDSSASPEMMVSSPMPPQNVGWGVQFVGSGDGSKLFNWAFVIDTGVDLNHSDLRVSSSWSRSYVAGEPSPTDNQGHGTHVAGIIAAKDNGFGVKGVAAGATVVSVKVLSGLRRSQWSELLRGVSYAGAVAWRGDVLNLSLGGPAPSWWDSLWGDVRNDIESCLRSIGNRGRYITIAAGNEADNANNHTPARTNGANIFTISNMTSARRLAGDSNFGNGPIDFAAPGSGIYSTYSNGRYATMSGTSMAAPHVAGILLINRGRINTRGRLVWDRDATLDPIAVVR